MMQENKFKSRFNRNVKIQENKWDRSITKYERYLKKYLKYYKKSLYGNIQYHSKYLHMKIKSDALNRKLDKAKEKNYLTKIQLKKILKVQLKIISLCAS